MDRLPSCPKCTKHPLLPLSDYAEGGSSLRWKVWACSDQRCGYSVRIDKGKVTYEVIRA